MSHATISTVNFSEVVAKLVDRGITPADARTALGALDLDIRAFDAEQAMAAGALRLQTRSPGVVVG
jgi:PIN domain nuclease of toxin-antitoxin system